MRAQAGWIAAVFGLLVAAVALYFFLQDHVFAASAARAEGVVEGFITEKVTRYTESFTGSDPAGTQTRSVPDVRFEVEGTRYDVKGRFEHPYRIGDTVTVLYPPGDPARGRIAGEQYYEAFWCGVFGGILLGGAGLLLLGGTPGHRKERD